jgi:uncharacterized protein (TIGR02996 family)
LVSDTIEVKRNLELEAAIVAKPHDRARYLAYARWLVEQGDPRGELITLGERAPRDRTKYGEWMSRMTTLQNTHLAAWLGDSAGKELHRLGFLWSMGFLHSATIRPPTHERDASTKDLVAAVLESPIALVLKQLSILGPVHEIADEVPAVLPGSIESLQLFYDPRYPGHERDLEPFREKFTKHRRTVNIKPHTPV